MMRADLQAQIVVEARSLLGVPFLHQGRTMDGVDCAGVLSLVAAATGLAEKWMDRTDYPHIATAQEFRDRLELFCDEIAIFEDGKYAVGSILVFEWAGEARHSGWCLGDTVIHAYSPSRKVVEHPIEGRWEKRLRSVWTPRLLLEMNNG